LVVSTSAGATIGQRVAGGTNAHLSNPSSVAAAQANGSPPRSFFVHDYAICSIRAITAGAVVTTLSGPTAANCSYADSTTPSDARFNQPRQGVRAPDGVLYLAGGPNHRIRAVFPNGTAATFAGNGSAFTPIDAAQPLNAPFNNPTGLARDSRGFFYVADTGNGAMRMISPGGAVSTLAGSLSGVSGFAVCRRTQQLCGPINP
jgi:hypothetical protein